MIAGEGEGYWVILCTVCSCWSTLPFADDSETSERAARRFAPCAGMPQHFYGLRPYVPAHEPAIYCRWFPYGYAPLEAVERTSLDARLLNAIGNRGELPK